MPRDADLLDDLRQHAEEAFALLDGFDEARFTRDRLRCLALERLMEIIGEAAGQLSPEAREAVPHDWKGLRGLRNLLAHQYGHVNPGLLYRTAKARLPDLLRALD